MVTETFLGRTTRRGQDCIQNYNGLPCRWTWHAGSGNYRIWCRQAGANLRNSRLERGVEPHGGIWKRSGTCDHNTVNITFDCPLGNETMECDQSVDPYFVTYNCRALLPVCQWWSHTENDWSMMAARSTTIRRECYVRLHALDGILDWAP